MDTSGNTGIRCGCNTYSEMGNQQIHKILIVGKTNDVSPSQFKGNFIIKYNDYYVRGTKGDWHLSTTNGILRLDVIALDNKSDYDIIIYTISHKPDIIVVLHDYRGCRSDLSCKLSNRTYNRVIDAYIGDNVEQESGYLSSTDNVDDNGLYTFTSIAKRLTYDTNTELKPFV